MFNLIRKDLILGINKRVLGIFIAYFLIIAMTSGETIASNSIYILVITTMTYFIVSSCFAFDDRLKGEYVINSLPIKRNKIVFSKYVSVIVYGGVACIATGVLGAILYNIGFARNLEYISLEVIIKSFYFIMIMCAINFPFNFLKGYRLGRIISFGTYFIFFALINVIGGEDGFVVGKLIKPSLNMNYIFLILSITLFIISMIISMRIYNKKEL